MSTVMPADGRYVVGAGAVLTLTVITAPVLTQETTGMTMATNGQARAKEGRYRAMNRRTSKELRDMGFVLHLGIDGVEASHQRCRELKAQGYYVVNKRVSRRHQYREIWITKVPPRVS